MLTCVVDIESVELFLRTAKREIAKGNRKFVGYRMVNYDNKTVSAKQALLDLGITKEKQIWEYILKLEASDCVKIEKDRDFTRDNNDEFYVFEILVHAIRTYVKLTINDKGVLCLSFHKCRYQEGVKNVLL